MSKVTFVTAYINIYDKPIDKKDNNWRYQQFERIAKTGIQICLYTDSVSYNDLIVLIEKYPNVKMMKTINLEDTFCFQSTKYIEYSLPDNRNITKDIDKYMFVQHSKIEFVNDAIQENPWNSTHFSWLDFSCAYILRNPDITLEHLFILSKRRFIPKMLVMPGCWNSLVRNNASFILNDVHWRFCGTFFLGDAESLIELSNLYRRHFDSFMREHHKLIWEVNFWAWLEANTEWKPNWYKGDHNDCIINIPTQFYALHLNDNLIKTCYDYPKIENFEPSSASYLYHNGEHVLNTRYVNYSYSSSGSYLINDPKNTLITKNIVSKLDCDFTPYSYEEMDELAIELPSFDTYSIGLEDIRLYSFNNKIKFIATNVNYVGNRTNRMIVGNYDPDNLSYTDYNIIQPPTNTGCEKNWTPLIKDNEEYFIYKWSPFELGKINAETNKLEIIESYEISSPDFHRVRGSTIFIDKDDSLLGMVHFCEETWPRQYYHMLIRLDRKTFKPLSYSDPFCFQHFGVEFCIGFTIKDDKYVFWISKKDNDAIMVNIDINKIPITHMIK